MSNISIYTNNQPRDIVRWYELTPKEQKEFDYIDSSDRQEGASFFRYRGNTYDLGEFMRLEEPARSNVQFNHLKRWDGYASDSYFSGVIVKYVENFERVVVGRYIS